MKLPVIKHVLGFVETHDQDWVVETIELLEYMTDLPSIKDEERDVIGELLSNFYGALEVHEAIKAGTPAKEALNQFMGRVLGSIDK